MENIENKDVIEIIYQAQEEVLDEKIKQVNRLQKDKIKEINIEKALKSASNATELSKILEQIEENYSIKIAEYTREFYKQGFKDGVNLIINCFYKEKI